MIVERLPSLVHYLHTLRRTDEHNRLDSGLPYFSVVSLGRLSRALHHLLFFRIYVLLIRGLVHALQQLFQHAVARRIRNFTTFP